jgi:sRNA-binding carbon storage regulator CsrA
MALAMTVAHLERIKIGESIFIWIGHAQGRKAVVWIEAPSDMRITREGRK